ncbi:hypothetical protein [Novosphingobium olei]|uniref:Uncharacterized protein n=1 Tax=Novosphingobium olei TaxID=2728851 RepID=A0A7Y0BNP7_9SPHN|nr:hypothetical protein [Novosphingobium olei]NML93765.1 hypothetical protein [Novosphingobium olei]
MQTFLPVAVFAFATGWFGFDAWHYRRRLTALRNNCWVRNERQHFVRYANASPDVRAAAETTKEN